MTKSVMTKQTKFDFSVKGITGGAMLETIRLKENGLYPVPFRITYNRIRKRYRSSVELTKEDWARIETSKIRELVKARETLQKGLADIKEAIEVLVNEKAFSFDALNRRLSGGKGDSLIAAFNSKVTRLNKAGRVGTAEFYSTASNSIQTFTYPSIKLNDVTVDWLKRYESWMVEKGKSYTTIGMYMRAIRSILNESGITPAKYPFGRGKYEIPEGETRKKALTLNQIGKIASAELSSDTERMCRDLWLFMYLCNGINVNDMLLLRYSDIKNGEISWKRKKTIRERRIKANTYAIYLPEMAEIVKRWGNPEHLPDQYIFPFLPQKASPVDEKRIVKNVTSLINKKMKIIAKSLKIDKISTYTARHSFATVLKRSGANISYISEALSHSDLRTTQAYLDSFEKDTRKDYAKRLLNYKK